MEENKNTVVDTRIDPVKTDEIVVDPIAAKDEEISRLTAERDNYKKVALKRLGKLPNDADFVAGEENTELSVEEQVRISLMNEAIKKANQEKDNESHRLAKENAELHLALKNRPNAALGGGSGDSLEVKDNVLSEEQIKAIKAKGERLKVKDLDAFVETTKKNILNRR